MARDYPATATSAADYFRVDDFSYIQNNSLVNAIYNDLIINCSTILMTTATSPTTTTTTTTKTSSSATSTTSHLPYSGRYAKALILCRITGETSTATTGDGRSASLNFWNYGDDTLNVINSPLLSLLFVMF